MSMLLACILDHFYTFSWETTGPHCSCFKVHTMRLCFELPEVVPCLRNRQHVYWICKSGRGFLHGSTFQLATPQ